MSARNGNRAYLVCSDLSDGFVKRWRTLLLFILTGLALGSIWAATSTPYYEAQVVAVPVENQMIGAPSLLESIGGVSSLIGMGAAGGVSRKQESISILRSRTFLQSFITDLELIPVLTGKNDPSSWKSKLGIGSNHTLGDAFDRLNDELLSITDDRRSGLVIVRITWLDRIAAADWANRLVDRLNKDMRARAIERATREMQFLEEELGKTESIEIRQAVFGLIEAQLKNLMLANVSEEFALRVLDPAFVPDADKAVNLSRPARVVLALFLAILASFLFVLWKEIRIIIR